MSRLLLCGMKFPLRSCPHLHSRAVYPVTVVVASNSRDKLLSLQPERYSSTNQNESLVSRGWRKLAVAVKTFMAGSKALYYDVREMYEIRSRYGTYLITKYAPRARETDPGNVDFPLSRQQLQFSYNTRKSLVKMLPTVTLFFIPFFGYFVPLVAFMFPDKLLSHHFLNEEDREEFAMSRFRKSAGVFQGMLENVRTKISEEQWGVLANLNKEISSSNSDWKESLSSIQNNFGLTLDQPSLLCKCWRVRSWIPINSRRQSLLANHMYYLFTCDWLLLHEGGVDKLTDKQIIEACLERNIGFNEDTLSVDVLKTQLHFWTSITTSYNECPVSLMAHLPVFQYSSQWNRS